jgi:microcystin-dependent protein
MPIVIQDLLASDTISQAADKINFNFDQLILNGGGAPGPAGPAGPTGPIGGRGLRGATWYKDTTGTPGVDPNSIIILGLNNDDLYLQADGQIWRYNGNVWIESLINLTGPQGEPGPATGFAYVGGFPGTFSIANENVVFPIIMLSGSGATANNQGVSTLMIGAVGGNVIPPPGITFDSSFKISDGMAKQLDSSLVSTLIHQKNSGSFAIKFMGGGEQDADKYEQSDLQKLTGITLGVDDSFDITVPKAATIPTALSNLIGFNLNTIKKGQQFFAGKYIKFISGTDSESSGFAEEISDVIFNVNTSNTLIPAKFSTVIIGPQNAKFEIGGSIALPQNAVDQTGTSLTLANIIHLTGNQIELKRNSANRINVSNTGVIIQTGDGPLALSTTSSRPININANGSVSIAAAAAIDIESAAAIDIDAAAAINIDAGIINIESAAAIDIDAATSINIKATTGITNTGNVTITGTLGVGSNTTVGGTLTIGSVAAGAGELLVVSPGGVVQKTSNFANASIPIGGIIMWSGASVPSGFALCDGGIVNGSQTPDLRGRFIVGQDPRTSYPGGTIWDSNYNGIGNTGGAKDVTLMEDQMPSHTHTLVPGRNFVGFATRGRLGENGDGDAVASNRRNAPNVSPTGINPTGGGLPHENRPPYFVLAFIMYVGV